MARNRVPAYCVHKATNQAFATIPDGSKRKTKYLGRWGSEASLTAYRTALRELKLPEPVIDNAIRTARTSISLPQEPPPESSSAVVTVRVLYDHFLTWAPTHYRLPSGKTSREVKNFRDSFKDTLAAVGTKPVALMTKRDLELVRDRMVSRGLSRKVINQRISRIVHVFRWGTEENRTLVPETVAAVLSLLTPLEAYRTAAPEKEPIVGVPPDRVEKVIAVANPVLAAMLTLQLLTGMRPGEVRGIKKKMVVQRDGGWVADFGIEHKMAYRKQRRAIPLGDKTVRLLKTWIAKAPTADSYLFRPEQVRKSRLKGTQFSDTSYAHSLAAYCKKASVPRFAPNQIRHTVGEEVRRTHGLDHVQALLGHKNRQSSERYAPVIQELAAVVAKKRG